mgnify:FL=1
MVADKYNIFAQKIDPETPSALRKKNMLIDQKATDKTKRKNHVLALFFLFPEQTIKP